MDLIKIEPDVERAKSLLQLALLRLSKLSTFNTEKESSLIAESYYEICKEMITGILFLDGYKTLSHKDLIEYISSYKEFSEAELSLLDSLRKRRNDIVYYGVFVDSNYIQRNSQKITIFIQKLKEIIENKIKK